jgi:filamentous hemagglutinin family protein
MKTSLRPEFRLRPSALAVALAFAPALVFAQTLPTAPSVVQGSANVTRPGAGQMNVQQNSQNVVINWQSFSIGANGRVVFNQPNARSVALNRVTGSDPSAIFGSLSANGKVFLVNPNGVLFGAGASVNVGGLVASTLNISDSDFSAGRYNFTRGNAAPAGVVNEGSLQAAPGGVIALVGSTASNSGTIAAPQGTVALASGKTVTLDFQGDGLTQLRVTEADLQALAANTGTLAADGGRVLMLADTTQATGFVVNQGGIVRARSLTQGPGGVVIAGGAGDVSVTGSIDTQGSSGQRGGDVNVSGRNVGLLGTGRIDASGDQGGGHVQLVAGSVAGSGGVVVVAGDAQIAVDAGTRGNGGRVDLTGDHARTSGSFSARGGALGGDGGLVKLTISGGVETAGMRVNASAARGQAGTLNIDPFDVFIYDLDPANYQPRVLPDPFVPVGESYVFTNDINATLNNGTNVTITTGAAGSAPGGTISIGRTIVSSGPGTTLNANIVRSVGTAPVTLRLDAALDIVTAPGTTNSISSTVGPLNVDFNSNATGPLGGGIVLSDLSLLSNGGNVRLFGGSDPAQPSSSTVAGVNLNAVQIDTRIGQLDANAGGDISILGQTLASAKSVPGGVNIVGSTLSSSTGAITVRGSFDPQGTHGLGTVLINSTLESTSGAITLTGLGQSGFDPNTQSFYRALGIDIINSTVSTSTGTIDIRGGVQVVPAGSSPGSSIAGVELAEGTVIRGNGAVNITGSTDDNGPGVLINAGSEGPGASVSGGHVTVRASNGDTGSDALVIDGTITSTGITNLRPGQVDATGAVAERSDVAINIGGNIGLGLTQIEFDNISAGTTLVLGSNQFGGVITVQSATTLANNLTLQTGAGGSIDIGAPLSVGGGTLALVSAGAVSQGSFFAGEGEFAVRDRTLEAPLAGPNQTATLTAGNLLVRAASAELDLAGNSVDTLAANTGTGTLLYANNKALVLGPVAAVGVDAASNAALALDASSLTGGAMTVRNFAGNMTLAGNIGASSLDLVTPGTFQNPGNSTITIAAGGRWHLFADTWVGETRGGLAGNGALPNIYGCSFGVTCAIAVSQTNNAFIYAQRPTLAVTVNNQSRLYGDANPTFSFSSTGLLNGDTQANVVGGAPSTTAGAGSNVGNYAINGTTLTSPAGYLLTVTNGALAVNPATLTYVADPATRTQGQPNPAFNGTVTGLRNEDSLNGATTGTLTFTSPATTASGPGNYAINGGGLSATNYVFTQAEGNSAALAITAGGQSRALAVLAHELGAGSIEPRREDTGTYVYDRNLGLPQMCVPDSPLDVAVANRSVADLLAVEWSRLRTRPNISNCFDSGRKNACGDF